MSKDRINIVYITDEGFAEPTLTSIRSIYCNRTKSYDYRVYCILNNVHTCTVQKLLDMSCDGFQVIPVDINQQSYKKEILADMPVIRGVTATETAMFKFLIQEILMDEDRVLYLDGDTIIQNDLVELYMTDISNQYVAAVPDMGEKFDLSRDYTKRIGSKNFFYFNSGVMLLNLEKMREDKVKDELFYYRANGSNYFMDQDALNFVLGQQAVKLPYKYNFLMSTITEYNIDDINRIYFKDKLFLSIEECLARMKIYHLAGALKPWNYNMPWSTELYYKYATCDKNHFLKSPLVFYRNKTETLKVNSKRKDWIFPFELIERNSKLILYGAGIIGAKFKKMLDNTLYCKVISWVDSNWEQYTEEIENPEVIVTQEYDYIFIAIANYDKQEEVEKYLVEIGVPVRKIVRLP